MREYKKIFGVRHPSVTEILQYYPKGEAFRRWLGSKSYEEAEKIRDEAGTRGSNVHEAIEQYLRHQTKPKDLSDKGLKLFNNFLEWYEDLQKNDLVEVLDIERPVINKHHKYVGTIDLIIKLNKEIHLIDFKTSNSIHTTHLLQLSAYKHAYSLMKGIEPGLIHTDILHLKKPDFIMKTEDNFDIFLATKKIHDYEKHDK